ncbi:MAG: histidinol-phosphatase HisJ family protein [Luteolibacter sp.]
MPADYHTHTPLCRHAVGTPQQYVEAALAAGISEYGISCHAPQRPEPFDDWRMLEHQLPDYLEWIAQAKEHAGNSIPVRAGLECDWLDGCEPWIESLAQRHDWDYLIGSVHYLGAWDFDNPKWLDRWAESDIDTIWDDYWQRFIQAAKSGLFDIMAHPDLVKKFGYRPKGDLARYYEAAIEAVAAAGIAIEINTAGWHKPCAEAYPSAEFLAMAAKANIPLVISSDAHAPNEIGRDFPRAIELAKSAGFTHTVKFCRRKRSEDAI